MLRTLPLLPLLLCGLPCVAAAGTGTSSGTDEGETDFDGTDFGGTEFGATTDGSFHESTQGVPLYEGPAVNDPPIRIKLDDDGLCRVGGSGGGWLVVMLVIGGLVRRRSAPSRRP